MQVGVYTNNNESKYRDSQGISNDLQKNINVFVLKIFPKYFIIEPKQGKYNSALFTEKKRLIIDKSSKKTMEISFSDPLPSDCNMKDLQEYLISTFLGVISILNRCFLVVVDEISQLIKLENHEIYQISGVGFFAFDDSPLKKEINSYICNLKKGYIGAFKCIFLGKELSFALISRRSFYRNGTRYNARGIDDDGYVANFVETEQILYYLNYCCSHIQIRGSAPIFWQQRGLTAQTKITRSPELTTMAFLKHMTFLQQNHNKCLLVNLLAQSKAHEQLITDCFENQVKITHLPYIRYEYFDFHDIVKGKNYEKINPFVKKLALINEDFKFFAQDLKTGNILLAQMGVLRTNCLDCLDRTNFLMTKIGASLVEIQFRNMNIECSSAFGSDILTQMDNIHAKHQHEFIINFKHLWADNGDALSRHYAGTASTISNVTRTGKSTFLGLFEHGVKSLERFYAGNFEDSVRQECIDLITGRHTETEAEFDNLDQDLKIRENEFALYREISIMIVTWNAGGFEPFKGLDFSKDMLNVGNNERPDLMVVGLQEIVDLKSIKNVMVPNNEKLILTWQNFLLSQLKSKFKENYIFISSKNLVGILLLVFAHENLKNRITKVDYDSVKCGVMNKLGNKGAIIIRFHLDDTSLCFINCHLEAGHKKMNERVNNVNDIHWKAFQKEGVGKKKEEKIENMDYKFLFGDMNFRVNLPNFDVRSNLEAYQYAVSKNDLLSAFELLKPLLEKDQLSLSKSSSEFLEKYQEGSIMFAPTYKYDVDTDIYDSSKKQRIPSWCDRILIWSNESQIVKQRMYKRCEYKFSDHKPVCAYYVINVKTIDHNKRKLLVKKLYENEVGPLEAKEVNLLDSDEKDTYFNNNLNESCERVYTLEREETTEDQNDIDKVFGKLI